MGHDPRPRQEQARRVDLALEGCAALEGKANRARASAGQLTTFIADSLTSAIQPAIASVLTISLVPTVAGLTLLESPRPGTSLALECGARLLTTVLLSPLDLVRTRLIAQASAARYRRSKGPLHALRQLIEDEGGLATLFFHSNLLLPALLEGFLRPLIHLGTPLLLDRVLGLRADRRPYAYGLAELGLGTLGLVLVLPIETVRRRLQLQSRATGTGSRPYRACVETRPVPYAGIVDALYRIITEETTSVPPSVAARRGRSRKSAVAGGSTTAAEDAKSVKASGLGQLYRGFGVGFVANLVVFGLGLVSDREVL
jgi:fusion and transport protein UGO1